MQVLLSCRDSLTELYISNNNIGDEGVAYLINVMKGTRSIPKLHSKSRFQSVESRKNDDEDDEEEHQEEEEPLEGSGYAKVRVRGNALGASPLDLLVSIYLSRTYHWRSQCSGGSSCVLCMQ